MKIGKISFMWFKNKTFHKTIKFLHLKKVIYLLTVNDLKEPWFTQSNTINVRTIIFSKVLTVQTNFFTLEESHEENGTLLYHDF